MHMSSHHNSRFNEASYSSATQMQLIEQRESEQLNSNNFFNDGLVSGKSKAGIATFNIRETINYSVNGMDWREEEGKSQISLALNALHLLMPEFVWNEYLELSSLQGVILERFLQDFVSVIPSNGGRIPFSEMARWVETVRELVALKSIDELKYGGF